MVEQKIEFRKVREFGENLSDTFLFIRQNIKPLLKSFFAICGVFMIGYAIFNGIYQSRAFSVFDQLRKGLTVNRGTDFTGLFTPEYFLTILLGTLFYVSMRVALGAYIKFYVENNNTAPSIEQVWKIFIRYFLKVLVFNIPIFLLILVGTLCCFAPGIWLLVVLMPFDLILIVEDASFENAFSRNFSIIRDNFWITLSIYLVAGLIYSFGASIIGVIVAIIVGATTFISTDSIGTAAGIATSFLVVVSRVFYIIFFISAALQYYNLVERRDGTGIMQRVENMGSSQDDFDNIQENY
jgi:hypothetical protein